MNDTTGRREGRHASGDNDDPDVSFGYANEQKKLFCTDHK